MRNCLLVQVYQHQRHIAKPQMQQSYLYPVPDRAQGPSARTARPGTAAAAHSEIATAMNDAELRWLGTFRQRRQHLRFVEQ